MASHSFKEIPPVLDATAFVDMVLNRTQRRTPTVVHPQYDINRIRKFYMRKVRFTQETINEKLTQIIDGFPKIEDIHPFYGDLLNVLYDKDHFKAALGHLARARQLVESLSKDYVGLLKFGDDAFRCKNLKRAALGRMMTVLRKLKATLAFLEEVRRHMSRLPSIDPTSRTLLVAGFPNVGKSSFLNLVTNADAEVQPYPFTTQSLYVGHCHYKYESWQVIDTPGILDRPLEARGTIEMTAITALANLQATVCFFIDISGNSGYSIETQVNLLRSMRPLFEAKPLLVVTTKTDIQPWDTLKASEKKLIEEVCEELSAPRLELSNVTKEGVMRVRNEACELLRARRVEARKAQSGRMAAVEGRVRVTMPKPRDGKPRPPSIPPSVIEEQRRKEAERAAGGGEDEEDEEDLDEMGRGGKGRSSIVVVGEASSSSAGGWGEGEGGGVVVGTGPGGRVLERDLERASGGAGLYSIDLKRFRDLEDPAWAGDIIPELREGRNVADYIDPDLYERLEALEKEHAELVVLDEKEKAAGVVVEGDDVAALAGSSDPDALITAAATKQVRGSAAKAALTGAALVHAGYTSEEERALAEELAERRDFTKHMSSATKTRAGPRMPNALRERGHTKPGAEFERDGDDVGRAVGSKRRRGRFERDGVGEGGGAASSAAGDGVEPEAKRTRSRSVVRGVSHDPARSKRDSGIKDIAAKSAAIRDLRRAQRLPSANARKGEADRHIPTKMPKHLFSGKRGIGKTDRR